MRGGLCAVVTVVLVAVCALACFAEQPVQLGRVLPVFDQQGKPVPPSIARATGFAPVVVDGTKPQTIRISAAVIPSLKVSLSSTEIAWEIKQTGVYQAKAIDIAVNADDKRILGAGEEDASLLPRPVATMVIQGAGDLSGRMPSPMLETQPGVMPPFPGRSLPTFYAIMPTYARGVPPDGNYQPAEKFNGGHALRSYNVSLWNKLTVSDKMIDTAAYPGGKYQDEFTVTFLQAI